MKTNVNLDKEWYERNIKELKLEVSKRDSMLVQQDLVIERLRESLRTIRDELKELNRGGNYDQKTT